KRRSPLSHPPHPDNSQGRRQRGFRLHTFTLRDRRGIDRAKGHARAVASRRSVAPEPKEKKSLPSFAFGTNSFILAPQISNQVLSCLVDPTDITGLVTTSRSPGHQSSS